MEKTKNVDREEDNESRDRNDEIKSFKKDVEKEINNESDVKEGKCLDDYEDKVISQMKVPKEEMDEENSKEDGDR